MASGAPASSSCLRRGSGQSPPPPLRPQRLRQLRRAALRRQKPRPAKTASKAAATPAASDPQIASAKASGMVWVNTDSGVYHKGGRWYGKTKTGKFMTEAEAKAAGYKASEERLRRNYEEQELDG